MAQAVRCPVCKGTGTVTPPDDGQCTAAPFPKTCHGCGGRGWVVVPAVYPECRRQLPYDPHSHSGWWLTGETW